MICISLVPLIFPYSAQILLENALLCQQNARLKNPLLCSKFCVQNLSKPSKDCAHGQTEYRYPFVETQFFFLSLFRF